MTHVFLFDEDAFANEFETALTGNEPVVDPLEDVDEEDDLHDEDYETLVKAYLQPNENLHPRISLGRSIPRRRSSVYRRLSIKLTSSISSYTQELIIPSNYGSESSKSRNHRVLSDFTPLKVLGQGAYGKVHLVQDIHTKKLYAQKQLKKPKIDIHQSDDITKHNVHIKRTILERQILTNITHHPNIVKLFYALQDHDKFYLILEYIPGGELFHHLTSANNTMGNVFKEEDVAFYSAQMSLGLRHLHKLGIVYRDLKPENCLLNSNGHLVLTDFGLSKDIGSDKGDSCTSIIGTPEYMAPEILKGEEYDFAVDWWSLGCVIYDMMTGKPPFTGNSHKAIQDKIIKNKLKLPFYFSLDAKDFLNKLLNKNKTKRFPVDDKWETFQNHRFFRKINWKALEAQDYDSITPPIIPVITDPILAENFSEEFTGLRVSDYNAGGIAIETSEPTATFNGFSYTASNSYLERFA